MPMRSTCSMPVASSSPARTTSWWNATARMRRCGGCRPAKLPESFDPVTNRPTSERRQSVHLRPRLPMTLRPLIAALLLAAASPAFAATTSSGGAQSDNTRLITADRLLDVRTGRWPDNVWILVRDGRIADIAHGPGAMIVTTDTPIIDLKGMSLVPGLIDMHVHLDSDPSYGGYTGLQFGDRFWSVLQVKHAKETLEAGF